jgi:hypothetical protein
LNEGDLVEFEVVAGPKGPQAKAVRFEAVLEALGLMEKLRRDGERLQEFKG